MTLAGDEAHLGAGSVRVSPPNRSEIHEDKIRDLRDCSRLLLNPMRLSLPVRCRISEPLTDTSTASSRLPLSCGHRPESVFQLITESKTTQRNVNRTQTRHIHQVAFWTCLRCLHA